MKNNFHASPVLFFLIMFFALMSASGGDKGALKMKIPPGTKKLAENFYYDQMDIVNVHWREYMYWNKRVFGDTSTEYLASMPDTTLFSKENPCLKSYITNYLSKPIFNYSPVTGISLQQARAFCKWRSDRVMERRLILEGKLKEAPEQNAQNHFTIEKYFSGTYQNAHPDTAKEYYLQYRLPNANDLVFVLQHTVDTTSFFNPTKVLIGTTIYHSAALQCGSFGEHKNNTLLTGFRCVAQWKKWGE